MATIELDKLTKVFPDGETAVQELDLQIDDGEFMVFVGPSGCGKTTALRMIAGLETVSSGHIRIGDTVVDDLGSRERDIAMIFQSYALYPHLSVEDNIAFALKLRRTPKDEVRARVTQALETLGLTEMRDRKPRQLSGGQRQRVAMGRAIVRDPRVYLMDEPLSNLDAKLRVQMRAGILALQREQGVTTIYVTHDQTEAMTMGHRVAVMRKGVLQQVDSPQTLYDRPVNQFVAGFIGSPPMNMVDVTLRPAGEGLVAAFGDHELELGPEMLRARPGLQRYAGRTLALGVRPEDIEDAALAPGAGAGCRLTVRCRLREALGSHILVHFGVRARMTRTDDVKELAADTGDASALRRTGEDEVEFVAAVAPRSAVREGEPVTLAVDTTQLHFFDLESGAAIYN